MNPFFNEQDFVDVQPVQSTGGFMDNTTPENNIYGPHGLSLEPGLNINPNRERTIIEDHVVETIPGEWRGNMYIEPRDVKVSGVDMYSIRNTEVEYDDGTIGYLSFGEMNEDWNPNLQREYRRIEEENNNLSFEPYTEGKNRPGQWRGNFYVEPTYERTVIPFEKELTENKNRLKELKENSELSPEEAAKKLKELQANGYSGNKIPTLDTHVPKEFHFMGEEPSDELVKEYFIHNKKEAERAEARRNEMDRAIANMDEGDQVATKIYNQKRYDDANADTLNQRGNEFEAKLEAFKKNPDYKKLSEFELNVIDPDYNFNIKEGEEVIELANGKKVPKKSWDNYQRNLTIFNNERDALEQDLTKLIDDQETIKDSAEELDLLKRNYSLMDKFGFNVATTFGDLFYGGIELFAGGELEMAQERRKRVAAEREMYRPDVQFGTGAGQAFDSWSNFGRFIFEETGRQLPIFALIAASGGTAGYLGAGMYGSAAISGTTLGLMTGGQQMGDMTYQEYLSMLDGLDYNDKEYSDLNKVMTGLGFGAAEGVFGTMPTFLLGSRFFSNASKNMIRTGQENILKQGGFQYFKNRFAKEVGIGILGESPSEGLTQITQNWLTERPLLENVGHATFSGGFFGGTLGGGSVMMGAAARSMMDQDQYIEIENNFKKIRELKKSQLNYKGDKRKIEYRELDSKIKSLQDKNSQLIQDFEQQWSTKMTKGAFETYKQMMLDQADIRQQAIDINNDTEIDEDLKQKVLQSLAEKYQSYEAALNTFKSPEAYANKFALLEKSDGKRYNKILEQARANLNKEGKNITDVTLNQEANNIYTAQEYQKSVKASQALLDGITQNYNKFEFENENQARQEAAKIINDPKSTDSQKKFWQGVLDASSGQLNGKAGRIKDKSGQEGYTYITVKDNAIDNQRAGTPTHEVGHIVFWDKLGVSGEQFAPLADAIIEHLQKHEPALYQEMFGLDFRQRVESKDGKFDPMEVVMGLVERADQIDLSKTQNKHLMSYIGNFITGNINNEAAVDLTTTTSVVDFLVTLGQKIKDGTLTDQDINNARKNKVFQETIKSNKNIEDASDLDNKIDESAKSESTLFENTEMMGGVILNEDGSIKEDNWSGLSEDEKIQRAQQLVLFWENFLNKKIGQQITTDEIEQLALLNKFTGFDTDPSNVEEYKKSFGYRRGFIDIVKRWDPNKNNSLAAWIQSANNLPMRILEVAQESKSFGRFENRIDQQKEEGRPFEIASTDESFDIDKTTKDFNEFRKVLNIEKDSDLYNKTLEVNTDMFLNLKDNGKTIKDLIKTNPRRARTIIQNYAAKKLRADVTNIIGSQKSAKFKKFIRNEKTLQSLIDLLAVKHRARFPFLSEVAGTMTVSQSKANQQSDQGQFVSDEKAGNKIYKPIDLSKMNAEKKAETIDFIEKAFVDGLRIKGRGKKVGYVDANGDLTGVVEYDGRETTHKALKDALANELILDATFTAMEKSGDMNAMYDGMRGKLAENIKRDPQVAFSLSEKAITDLINRYLDEAKGPKGTDRAAYMRSEFEEAGLLDMYERAKSYIEENGMDGPNGFIQTLTSNNLPSEIGKLIRAKEIKWVRDGDFKFFKKYQKEILALAGNLDPRVLDILGIDFMGIHYRHLNPKKFKGFIKELENAASQDVQNDKHAYLLDNIENVMPVVDSGKLGKIIKNINEAATLQDKLRILSDNKETIQLANEANKNLRRYIVLKMAEANLSNETVYLMLQSQTNIINGFRALSTIEHFRLIDGIQQPAKMNPPAKMVTRTKNGVKTRIPNPKYDEQLKAYYDGWRKVDGYNEAWKQVKDNVYLDKDGVKLDNEIFAIDLLKTKNEHLGANSATMGKLAVNLFYNQIKTAGDVDNIFKDHITLFSTNNVLNGIDEAGGKVNQAAEFRVNMFMTATEANNHYHISGVKSADYIRNKKAKQILSGEIKNTNTSRRILHMANSLSSRPRKGISVFDFDDTLAKTNSQIIVTMPDGSINKINATEFALQSADLEAAGATFDFSEFNKVIDGKKGPLADLALKRQGKFGSKDIFVLTARPQQAAYAIHAFLKGIGLEIPIENITGLEDGRPEAKSDWILEKVAEGYNDFYFADDAYKNVKAVQDVLKYIDVKSDIQQAYSKSNIDTFEDKINEIIEHQSGVPKDAKYSQVVAKRKGANKGKYEFFVPPSADDFKGLLYYLAGKGEQGSKDLEWLIENLSKPYHKAIDAINIAKTVIKSDYKKILKEYPEVAKKLTSIIPGTDFTYDQGIRMFIWHKQKQDIPGIAKRDLNSVLKAINADEDLVGFANEVEKIGSVNDMYLQPDQYWDVGSILADLDNRSNKVGRKEFLKDWIARVDAVFTPDVLNKIEATYGNIFREALEDSLYRMKNGTNRPSGNNKIVNSWLNWINNSVGTIMFFNRRSALLQSISTINFLNWSDNNPLKAGMAWANQPQFWKDFAFIWNSPKLKQRRRGLQTDLQWQEIANAAKRSKNKANAVISYLLQIGFTPTQLVDNFAIAAGGAPFYRNRINTYLGQGMTQAEAEAKAFEDFSNVAEETQQSGDPALISQEQASPLGRLILSFQNTPMQMTRLQKKAGMMIYRRQRYPGMTQRQSDFTNMGKIIYYGMIQNFIFTSLQSALFTILPGYEEDDDQDYFKNLEKNEAKKAKVVNNMIDTLLRGSGLKGAVLSTIKNVILRYQREEKKGFQADHTYTLLEALNVSPPIGSKFRKVYGALQTKKFERDVLAERGWAVTADGKINISPMYDIAGNLTSALFNLPLDRVVNELESVIEMMDQRNASWQRIMLALGWRTWDVGARNEEEDLIKILAKMRRKQQNKKKKKKNSKGFMD